MRREEQVRELLKGVPVLARIPQVGRRKSPGPLIPNDLSLPALEAYRTLRTSLATRASGKPQAYLLTGCAPSEGKTTSAISLAVALAQGGGRVILIEADLRRPRIAASLGLTPEIGTEQVLSGESTLRDALMPIWFDSTPLHVLPARGAGAGLADRLSFAVAQHLITAAKEQADFVVIDSPPLTAVIDALPRSRSWPTRSCWSTRWPLAGLTKSRPAGGDPQQPGRVRHRHRDGRRSACGLAYTRTAIT